MEEDILKDLKTLMSTLRRKATLEYKKVKEDITHYQGMCKGMYISFEESASRIRKLIEKYSKE